MFLDDFSQKTVLQILSSFTKGQLILTMPDGNIHSFGGELQSSPARLNVRDNSFFQKVLFYGDIGFGEAYMDGLWDSEDITALISWMLLNYAHNPGVAGGKKLLSFNLLKFANRLIHLFRKNTKAQSQKNISEHYDLSNEFFELFLDESMTYSSAYYPSGRSSLEDSQLEKYRWLAEKVGIRRGMEVLEIGCGWGAFASFLATEFGCNVTGLTLSKRQLEKAQLRIKNAGLENKVKFLLQDYRDVQGQFDAIVSVEMIEAVGHEFLPDYFAQCHRLLKPQGVLGLQAIICPDSRYESGRKSVDWIQKHIFPGGQLPSISALLEAANKTGDLYLQHAENFGLHYARTLQEWRDKFEARLYAVRRLGFDDRFIRKWRYYLCYCEAAFAMRNINVTHLVFTRPNNTSYSLPIERPFQMAQNNIRVA